MDDSTIEIRRTVNLNYNLIEARKWRKDESFVPAPEDTLRYRQILKVASQNGHSYAISPQTIKTKKCRNCSFNTGSILVFRNASNSLMHSVYYDGGFYSKYGGWAAKTEVNINLIIKRYWDCKVVEEYTLDQKIIDSFLQRELTINKSSDR